MFPEITFIIIAAFIGVIVQSVSGMGMMLFLTPTLLLFLSPPTAIITGLISGILLSSLILLNEHRKREALYNYLPYLLLASIPGIFIGAQLISKISKSHLLIMVGLMILTTVFLQKIKFNHPHSRFESKKWAILSGLVAGIFNASTSMGGPALALWIRSFTKKIHPLRDTLNICFIFLNILSIFFILSVNSGSITKDSLWINALLVPIIFCGHFLGKALLRKVSVDKFRFYVFLAITMAGLFSLISGISKL
ncbi:MAG TPA: sulfite exporter TauE/SafE family protein [Patescibacteria group bacterium]|nr:sulfite exporter TauE/SafE family protein [Patescibacteria group bacterium]